MPGALWLSTPHRQDTRDHLANHRFDVLVIGGGITGAGIALDAASRGLQVALVEKQDYAEGTSSRSTKLIHGGLRYLKQGEIRLVREVGHERAILHRNAPHLVHAERMLLPIVRNGTYGRFATSIGLWLYDQLAGVKRHERRTMLNATQTVLTEPLLNPDGLLGGGLYYEYRTDDARLTIEVIKTAVQQGAVCMNYTEMTELLYDSSHRICGAQVCDTVTRDTYSIFARKVVNATGPWVDDLRQRDGSQSEKQLHLTKGVHVVIPFTRLPIRQSVYFDTPDGRMVFAIPRDDCTYLGTTDTDYHGSRTRPVVTEEDVLYLLRAANGMFPSIQLKSEDVVSSWAGLRPLIHEEGKSPSELSRKDEVFLSHTGLISIAGGKLTGYRKMAERVVNLVMQDLSSVDQRPFVRCNTDRLVLTGGMPVDKLYIQEWIDERLKPVPMEVRDQVEEDVWRLYAKYGCHMMNILELADEIGQSGNVSKTDVVPFAELAYTVQQEGVVHLSDFLIRRTGRLWFERNRSQALSLPMAIYLQTLLQWSDNRKAEELMNWRREFDQVTRFIDGPSRPDASQS